MNLVVKVPNTAPDKSLSQPAGYTSLQENGLIIQSKYSKIKVIDEGPLRQLYFRWEDNTDHHQTTLVRSTPWRQDQSYARNVLTAFLFMPRPKKVMLAGLGGGALVHFIYHYKLTPQLDVAEIDPEVINVAQKHFNLPQDPAIRLIPGDVAETLSKPEYGPYDLIIIDVLLNDLAPDTDSTGMPLKTRARPTLLNMFTRLSPWGTVLFNLHINDKSMEDIEAIQSVFPQVYYWIAPGTGNLIVAALKQKNRIPNDELAQRARNLDSRLHASFKYATQAEVVKKARYFNTEKVPQDKAVETK